MVGKSRKPSFFLYANWISLRMSPTPIWIVQKRAQSTGNHMERLWGKNIDQKFDLRKKLEQFPWKQKVGPPKFDLILYRISNEMNMLAYKKKERSATIKNNNCYMIGFSRVGPETLGFWTFWARNRHQRLALEIRLQSCNPLSIVHAYTLWHEHPSKIFFRWFDFFFLKIWLCFVGEFLC